MTFGVRHAGLKRSRHGLAVRRFRFLPATALICVAACSSSSVPRLLAFPDSGIRPRDNVDEIGSYGTAAASVLAVIDRDFGFHPFPIVFQFCPDAHAFEETLLETGYDNALARDTARAMQAVGGYRRVLLNEASMARHPWPARVATLAHEVGHSLQYEWGGGRRGGSDQWLREGFAEWLSMQVLDHLHGLQFDLARRRYTTILLRAAPSASRATRLEHMVTFPQWVELGQRRDAAVYAQAFLFVDFLIARHGLPAVVDYFQRFARSGDRETNFKGAFGEDLAGFESAAAVRLWPRSRR